VQTREDMRPSIALVLLAACAGPASVSPPRPLGVAEHRAEADDHDARAARHAAAAAEHAEGRNGYACGDTVLADQLTSGGERLQLAVPCWNTDVEASFEHRRAAARERSEAARHRSQARALEQVERDRCAGLSPAELDHTPFWHRGDIARVERLADGATLRGARVTFKAVRGLDGSWLEHALQCHRARAAAVGWDSRYMGYDPSLLPGVTTTVVATNDGLTVEIRAADADVAAVVAGRTEALLTDAVTPSLP
jgi:hypothetical protein